MAEELGKREAEFAIKRPQLERERLAAITAAQAALAPMRKNWPPELAEQERKKAEATAKLEADLKAYEARLSPRRWPNGKKTKPRRSSIAGRCSSRRPSSASNKAVLTKEPDGSILVTGRNTNAVVTIVAETELTGITGLRLEVLPDSRLPNERSRPRDRRQLRAQRARADGRPQGRPRSRPSRSNWRRPWPISARQISRSPRRSTAAPAIRQMAGPLPRPPGRRTGRLSRRRSQSAAAAARC